MFCQRRVNVYICDKPGVVASADFFLYIYHEGVAVWYLHVCHVTHYFFNLGIALNCGFYCES